MADIDKAAKDIATNLDASKADDVSRDLSLYSQQLSRDDFRKLITTTDSKEKDGVGLDLVIKYDQTNTPKQYAVIPKELHESAKKMAGLMDAGKTAEATELLNKVATQIDKDKKGDAKAVQKEFSLWAIAVDAYDKDGVGGDVTVDLSKPGLTGLEWNLPAPDGKK